MDYNINFPHLHIYLQHVIKSISIGSFDIAMYGIIIACGMLAGLGVACYVAKKSGQNPDTYFDLALVAIICSVIGARIYYVVFRWDLYKDDLLIQYQAGRTGNLRRRDSSNYHHIRFCKGQKAVFSTVV